MQTDLGNLKIKIGIFVHENVGNLFTFGVLYLISKNCQIDKTFSIEIYNNVNKSL